MNEFNADVLDRIMANATPPPQRDDEFTVSDLVARGMSRERARLFCANGMRYQRFERRLGHGRNGRPCWVYREKRQVKPPKAK